MKTCFLLQNVKELYDVAEKIVGLNIENLLNQSKSDAEEPSTWESREIRSVNDKLKWQIIMNSC